jgi:hypothetical protein
MVYKEYKPQTRGEIDFIALAAMPALVGLVARRLEA